MKKRFVCLLNGLGWFCLLLGLVMGCVREKGLDPGQWFSLQLEAGVQHTAGISQEDLLLLDVGMSRYFRGQQEDLEYHIPVYGQMQSAFNERELMHLADCRRLFAPTVDPWLNIGLAVAGVALLICGERKGGVRPGAAWAASAVILLPVAFLGVWAAVDFDSAFTFFHKILFTNDLWLLNPETDLLIRICPASMFASLGLRIGAWSAGILLGAPVLVSLLYKLDERKRKQHENPEI